MKAQIADSMAARTSSPTSWRPRAARPAPSTSGSASSIPNRRTTPADSSVREVGSAPLRSGLQGALVDLFATLAIVLRPIVEVTKETFSSYWATRADSDSGGPVVEHVVLTRTSHPISKLPKVVDEFDTPQPFHHLEAKLSLHSQTERRTVWHI